MIRFTIVVLLLLVVFATRQDFAADSPKPDIKPLANAIEKLVKQYYPDAKFSTEKLTIQFSFNLRKFMIHHALKTGEWLEASEDVGPDRGGINGQLTLKAGRYDGAAQLPQTFDKHYFKGWAAAPRAKKTDHYLFAHLQYPSNVKPEFLKAFMALVEDFESFLAKEK